jgi:hypothetical protein
MILSEVAVTLERNTHLKAERNRTRFFASELIDALRRRHINARWIPVSFEDTDRLEPELNGRSNEGGMFRTWGPAKRSVWSLADYRALEVYPEWRDEDGTAYRIILGEPSLDALKVIWHQRGWICAHCADPAQHDEMPNHDVFCSWGWLTHSKPQVFIKNGEKGFQRNPDVTQQQAEMALELLAAAQLLPYG